MRYIMPKSTTTARRFPVDNCFYNALAVHGPAADVATFKKQAVGYDPEMTTKERRKVKPCALNFHSLVPIPDRLLKAGDPTGQHWEDWEAKHWGVAGGALFEHKAAGVLCIVEEGKPNVLWYSFDTFGRPPIKFLKQVSKKWPTLLFLLHYQEEGATRIGIAKVKAGKAEHYQL